MRSRLAVLTVTVLIAASATACLGRKAPAQKAADAFFAAVTARDAATAAAATSDAAAAQGPITATFTGLGDKARAKFDIGTATKKSDTESSVAYRATWTFTETSVPGNHEWTYSGSVPVVKGADGAWKVTWASADLHPDLLEGEHLELARVQPERAALLDASGQPLFTKQPVVTVGVHPKDVTDLKTLAAVLAKALELKAADIEAQVAATPPDQFLPLITLRQDAYEKVRAQIHELPGTQFQQSQRLLGPTATFAQPLLGRVGDATKELIDASGGTIAAGDTTGTSGLQKAYNAQLSGTAGLSVFKVHAAGERSELAVLSPTKPATTVHLTLDRKIQNAADAALAQVTAPATIVAVQPSTGKVLAVANSAAAADQGNIAFTGRYPPGSTFKIVTYTAAFTANPKLTPASAADCPGTITVNGQKVHNQNDFSLGAVSLTTAFDQSCNTTAAQLGLGLPAGALVKTAQDLGLGAQWKLPVEAFSGSLPEPSGPSAQNDLAAAAYGQGKVLVSPLLMAALAGAAATGTTMAPSLDAAAPGAPGAVRPPAVTQYLNALMRAVVTDGTGAALGALPGTVEGKTGTAEFGTTVPPPSHSWFVGTRGDLAFSVFVFGGEHSTTAAVPLAKTFLTTLGG